MEALGRKSWFELDGRLDAIDFAGDASFRFPDALATTIIETFSKTGDWVFDPFAGFGTTLRISQNLGRRAIGFEIDEERAAFASRGLHAPSRVISDDVTQSDLTNLPKGDLLFTSPPFTTVNFDEDLWGAGYFVQLASIFRRIGGHLRDGAPIIVDVSNVITDEGFRPLAFQMAHVLAQSFDFRRDYVRCNTAASPAGPGVDHSHILVFANTAPLNGQANAFGDWRKT